MSFEKRSHYHIAVLVFKYEHGNIPHYMDNLLTISQNKSYNLRSSLNRNLITPNYNSDYPSFKVWNKIPTDIRCLPSMTQFKIYLNKYLLNN